MRKLQTALFVFAGFILMAFFLSGQPTAKSTVVLTSVPTASPSAISTVIWTETATVVANDYPEVTASPTTGPSSTATLTKPTSPATPTKVRQSLVDSVLEALAKESLRLRDSHKDKDEKRTKRIDWNLNEGRFNLLLVGYGETLEPPATIKSGVVIASFSLISYNVRTGEATIFSFTHDIRAPEVERANGLAPRGRATARRLGEAYLTKIVGVRNLDLTREVVEDITGLAVDFIVVSEDTVLKDVVDKILGGVAIDVPETFEVHEIWLNGTFYSQGRFTKGVQTLNGLRVIQYIKGVTKSPGYSKELENNFRKHQIFRAMLSGLSSKCGSKFWLDSGWALAGMINEGRLKTDFEFGSILKSNLSSLPGMAETLFQGECRGVYLPLIKETRYIVDPAHGDGGVQWVGANAVVNPMTRKDVEDGVYSSLDMEIPAAGDFKANPYGDLVTEYWFPTRELVKTTLLK